jgi:hypothetical protein
MIVTLIQISMFMGKVVLEHSLTPLFSCYLWSRLKNPMHFLSGPSPRKLTDHQVPYPPAFSPLLQNGKNSTHGQVVLQTEDMLGSPGKQPVPGFQKAVGKAA